MKKMYFGIGKIALSVVTLPLWFLKLFIGIGHLPDPSTGDIAEVIFRHTMLENVSDATHPVFAYASILVAVISAMLNGIALCFPDKRKLNLIANIVFWLAMVLFLILLLVAASVNRGY